VPLGEKSVFLVYTMVRATNGTDKRIEERVK